MPLTSAGLKQVFIRSGEKRENKKKEWKRKYHLRDNFFFFSIFCKYFRIFHFISTRWDLGRKRHIPQGVKAVFLPAAVPVLWNKWDTAHCQEQHFCLLHLHWESLLSPSEIPGGERPQPVRESQPNWPKQLKNVKQFWQSFYRQFSFKIMELLHLERTSEIITSSCHPSTNPWPRVPHPPNSCRDGDSTTALPFAVLHSPLGEERFSDIWSKPALVPPGAVSSCPVTFVTSEERLTPTSLQPPFREL